MNYLQLCQNYCSELGIAGGRGPTTVVGQQGELLNVTRWIRDACLDLDNMHQDWRYLHTEYRGVIPAGSRFPGPPVTPPGVQVRRWDRDSLVLDYESTKAQPMHWERWEQFRKLRQLGSAHTTVGRPTIFTVQADNSLKVFPTAQVDYLLFGEFWRRPVPLQQDTDEPAMPEEYHRVILCRAAIMYGNREDAPEIIAGMEAEYVSILTRLQSDQLNGDSESTMSAADLILEADIPGEW